MEISEIKSRLSMVEILSHYGLKAEKGNRLRCPFHEDKTPSMQIYPKTNTAYCFSASCPTGRKSLDVIDFVMHKESLSLHQAIEKCKSMTFTATSGRVGMVVSAQPEPAAPLPVLGKVFTYFKNAVANSKPGQDYLKLRGLDPLRIEVGYNTGQFHHGERKADQLIEACVKAGLLAPFGVSRTGSQAHKVFGRYSIVFALRNQEGAVSGLYFRNTQENSEIRHLYLKNSSGLYPAYPKPDTERLILTEAIIDAASLLQIEEIAQSYSVLACYGVNRFSSEHKRAIKGLPHLKEIIFAFDSDEAGNTAVSEYSKELSQSLKGVTLSKLELPEGEDLNSLATAHDPKIFLHFLEYRVLLPSPESLPEEKALSIPSSQIGQSSPPLFEEACPVPTGGPGVVLNTTSCPVLQTGNPDKLTYSTATARYYVQGGISKSLDSMRLTLVIEHPVSKARARNKADLYEDKQVEKLCKEVSAKLDIREELLRSDLYILTGLLEDYREAQLTKPEPANSPPLEGGVGGGSPLTAHEREQLHAFASKPNLIGRLGELLGKAGIVGEEKNRIFLLLIAASYKMPETLHALIQGSSGSGKTRLLKQISDCIPADKLTRLTRISDKVLYNYPETYFVNRLFCLEDMDGLSEDAEFAFRELQSNGVLSSAVSLKLESGQTIQSEKLVRGPIASMACTTNGTIYEDNMGRCFLVAVDESHEQTLRVIAYQNNKAAGEIDSQKEHDVKEFIQRFIGELKPYKVINPYANKISLPDEAHKIRRLNDLFQGFIKMVTVFNQQQRNRDNHGRLLTEIEDIQSAIDIIFESIVLKVDELDGSLRQFYEQLKTYLKKKHNGRHDKAEFSLREVRQALNISKTQLFRYAGELHELEYIRQCGGHINKGFTYQITYWDNYQALRERIRQGLQEQLTLL